jgi:nucleotide-binding universal stress UspA family protein
MVPSSGVMTRKTIRRILVAVDLSKSRDAAFDRALVLAGDRNAELYLLHTRPQQRASRFGTIGQGLEPDRREAERSRLRALVRSAKDEGVPVRFISAQGEPAAASTAHAHLVMANLIVVGRDFGSSRMWRTSRVAATVGRSAPVPVLIVPSQNPASHSPGRPFTPGNGRKQHERRQDDCDVPGLV